MTFPNGMLICYFASKKRDILLIKRRKIPNWLGNPLSFVFFGSKCLFLHTKKINFRSKYFQLMLLLLSFQYFLCKSFSSSVWQISVTSSLLNWGCCFKKLCNLQNSSKYSRLIPRLFTRLRMGDWELVSLLKDLSFWEPDCSTANETKKRKQKLV